MKRRGVSKRAGGAEHTPLTARAWQLAQLAALLAPKTFVTASSNDQKTVEAISALSSDGRILETLNRETAFEILLRDAEYLLDAAERTSRGQHAYQLFRWEPEFLSTHRIAEVFGINQWKGLTASQSVESLVEEILRALREHQAARESNTIPGLNLPPLSQLGGILWVNPEELKRKVKANKWRYWAERILLLAHLTHREQFRDRLERIV